VTAEGSETDVRKVRISGRPAFRAMKCDTVVRERSRTLVGTRETGSYKPCWSYHDCRNALMIVE
jgi:hypothetical protein